MSDEPQVQRQPRKLSPEMAAFFTEEHLERRRQAMARYSGWEGADALDPKHPAGHAEGIRTSTRLTRGGQEIEQFLAIALSDQPFPI